MKRGFTLIEMLTVVTILILLAAMTAPVISRVSERGNAVRCMANLKAMSQAVSVYLAENQGQFPPALVQDGSASKGWDFIIDADGQITPGLIWKNYGANTVLNCPSFHGEDNWQGEPHTGYNYNASFLGGMQISRRGRMVQDTASARLTHITNPSRTAMFGDGEYASGANKFMRSPLPGPLDNNFSGRQAGTQGFRHLGRTHVVFVDGNVQSIKPVPIPGYFEGRVAEGTGFLSADNSLYGGDTL